MLDIKFILNNVDLLRDVIKKRHVQADLDSLLALYAERKNLMLELENQRAQANKIAKDIPKSLDSEKAALVTQGRELNQAISKQEEQLRLLEEDYTQALYSIPNILAEDTPEGADDAENLVLHSHLEPRAFDFTPKDHLELGKA